ncbi:RNA-binding domain-protein [Diplogelasinospora grovesii]|uniref:RNA-binding domain-protein n=1 Tax=Diplogelasinospora grovesii TaxID=303347 RepID=A0AAN6NHU0_9PEZI|nr:RNA-binding domain-protein [Diplogelasinospora grovesii]
MAAQIAQWQSAYMPRDSSSAPSKATNGSGPNGSAGATVGSNGAGSGGGAHASAGGYGGYPAAAAAAAAAATTTTATEAADPNATNGTGTDKKKTVYREGGGKKWQDESLLEWDPSHLRLFVGNLAGETTDESLLKAFSRWKSVQKAKVIRDKRTTKSKGFGFVSFSDPDDFFQAAKEMNGKYIQSHPVVVHKAKTEIKPTSVKDDRRNNKNHKKGGGHHEKKSGSGMGGHDGASSYEPHLGPHGGGITKPGQKTRGGLKLLG